MNHAGEPIKVFDRNGWITNAMPVIAALKLLCGIIYLFEGDVGPASLWLLMATLWFLNYRWSRQTPFIIVSEEGMKIRSSPLAPAREITWRSVINAQPSGPNRLTLFLVSGHRYSVYLTWLDSKERKPLIRMVEKAVADKGATGE